jgi:hypothetical protein
LKKILLRTCLLQPCASVSGHDHLLLLS